MKGLERIPLKGTFLLTLCRLMELSAPGGELSYTTGELSSRLGCSQQTVSRHLITLESMGLIRRIKVARRESIRITPEGRQLLSRLYSSLRWMFEECPETVYFEGELFTGLGEGSYYVSQEGYRKQLRSKLGFEPYPGTLNLRLRHGYGDVKAMLEGMPSIVIEGFRADNRSFGPAKCLRAKVNDSVEAAVILALRSHYGPDVVEIVAGENLRERFNLKDGDVVRVIVKAATPQ
ncbi:MAG: DUF120 domain-containing protein [Candidatus Bathyarchaeia archaeon]